MWGVVGGGGGEVVRDAGKYLGPTPGNFKYPSDPPPGNLFWIHPYICTMKLSDFSRAGIENYNYMWIF